MPVTVYLRLSALSLAIAVIAAGCIPTVSHPILHDPRWSAESPPSVSATYTETSANEHRIFHPEEAPATYSAPTPNYHRQQDAMPIQSTPQEVPRAIAVSSEHYWSPTTAEGARQNLGRIDERILPGVEIPEPSTTQLPAAAEGTHQNLSTTNERILPGIEIPESTTSQPASEHPNWPVSTSGKAGVDERGSAADQRIVPGTHQQLNTRKSTQQLSTIVRSQTPDNITTRQTSLIAGQSQNELAIIGWFARFLLKLVAELRELIVLEPLIGIVVSAALAASLIAMMAAIVMTISSFYWHFAAPDEDDLPSDMENLHAMAMRPLSVVEHPIIEPPNESTLPSEVRLLRPLAEASSPLLKRRLRRWKHGGYLPEFERRSHRATF